ncbi:MAG: TSUP family transporter [Christensenellales bacterium]
MEFLLILYGLIGGILGGMGMGGGTLLIPLLTILGGLNQIESQAINLISFSVMAIISIIIHSKNKLINFKVALPLILSGFVFSIVGALLANSINTLSLKTLFGIFLVALGLFQGASFFIFDQKKSKSKKENKK